ncbi:AsmA family protein [Gluconobacter kanchanaburiensis]|uniref:Uncharacterized protein n=1 Tax=Gluconobacter kanchanaburiensis NBRC 103587 TaxID=1307948 RepID=A0A511B5J3_9PROT|nr:AsmA-like C-terminal region-containing protein [Gluconobacter kanchanaburiensis]MBF0861819.1 hypothetical protein [Gluconobacter kanchanaburiensis]GBR68005.1 hypothetical protein AA103587_0580 [Gluconobacter kanchanaburiensis NBRC 103587]GEK95658.1 hypothetical protein GKA01_08550 [Gluconobacter kanchanaburiensis NBRC 103587]
MLRWFLVSLLSLTVLLLALLGAGWIWIDHRDFAAFATPRLEKKLGRTVHIGALHVHPGAWLTIDADDISVANITSGSRPQMMTLSHLGAQIRLTSLIWGPPEARNIVISKFSGLFERTPAHLANWRFGPHQNDPRPPMSPEQQAKANTPPDLHDAPGLRNATILDSDVTYRSANGASYKTTLTKVEFASSSDNSPFTMTLTGAYNETPVTISAEMEPLNDLRKTPERPYGTTAHVTSGDMTSDFTGTLTDPLNFDGVEGHTTVTTPSSDALFSMAGMTGDHAPVKLDLSGDFSHSGNDWHFSKARGTIQTSTMQDGDFTLIEGSHGKPDDVTAKIGFGRLDINGLMPILAPSGSRGSKKSPSTLHADLVLLTPPDPDPLVHFDLSARQLVYNKLDFTNLRIQAAQIPNRIDVPLLRLGYIGASLSANGHIEADGPSSRIAAEVALTHGDIDRLRRVAGLAPVPVKGSLSFRVIASANRVHTLNEAMSRANMTAAVSMEKGEIAREIVEAASMDLRLLFRHAKGVTPITCLLGVLQMNQGVGTVVPLRLRTGAGTIAAKANFNLNRRWLDLVFASRPFSTSFFALDVPIRVSGRFDAPSLSLAKWSKEGRNMLADSNEVTNLPPALQGFAASNACARPTR